jgi:hypothetical protein
VALSGPASKTSTATVTTTGGVAAGAHPLTFTGKYGTGSPSSGGLTHSATVTLSVR